jgi:hypothetical protein
MSTNTALYKRRKPVDMLQLGTGVYKNLRTGEIVKLNSNIVYAPEANIPLTENSTFYFKRRVIVKMYDLGGGVYEYFNSTGRLVRGDFGSTDPIISAYLSKVSAEGGAIADQALLLSEYDYLKEKELLDKVGFWINKDFGFKMGTENPEHPEHTPIPDHKYVGIQLDDAKVRDWDTYLWMKEKGALATTMVNAKFIGDNDYLTWQQIHTMLADGWEFQCHTHSHARTDISGGDVPYNLGLTGCTNEQLIDEMELNDQEFVANGLPKPIHLAYPNYVTEFDRVLPIISKYRKTFRGGSADYTTLPHLHYIGWYSHGGFGVDFNNLGGTNGVTNRITLMEFYNKLMQPIHFASHGTSEVPIKAFCDAATAIGYEVVTFNEFYDRINRYRDKLINVIERIGDIGTGFTKVDSNFPILIYLDGGIKLGSKQGLIVFEDTYANIGSEVVNYFKDKGYRIAFWEDTSAEAMNTTFCNAKHHDQVGVGIDPVDNRILLTSHGFASNNMQVTFSGDVLPEPLVAGTVYFVRDRLVASFRIAATANGAAIDITTSGTNVRLSTRGFLDALPTSFTCFKDVMQNIESGGNTATILDFGFNGMSGTLDNKGFDFFRNVGIGSPQVSIQFNYNFLTGEIPETWKVLYGLTNVYGIRNKLTGGLKNLNFINRLENIQFTNNLLSCEIPREYGYMTNLVTFYLDGNQITGTIPVELSNCKKILRFRFGINNITSYEAGAIANDMLNLIELTLDTNAITNAADINQVLADCRALKENGGKNMTITLQGGTNAAPTGQGIDDKTWLNDNGCTVTTN